MSRLADSLAAASRTAVVCLLIGQMALPTSLTGQMAAQPTHAAGVQQSGTPLSEDERILHVLDRFTYGPRPGDVERVKAIGLAAWVTQQMQPKAIDDSALETRLASYPAMALPLVQLMAMYPTNAMIRQEARGRVNTMVPGGEAERAIYAASMAREEAKKNGKADANDAKMSDAPAMDPAEAQRILALPAEKRFSALCHMPVPEMKALRQSLRGDDRDKLTEGFTPQQLETLAAMQNPPQLVGAEVLDTKLLRDIYTERQLNEVMTDFWLNHFNVYVKKSQQAPYYIAAYERSTIRPRALGRFEDLLVATAISPAMLNYLDNSESVGPHSQFASRATGGKRANGLNENYARELMELHTLGVGGGYTQKDVTEVAKVFTGWTVGPKQDRFGLGMYDRAGMLRPSEQVDEPISPGFDPSKHEPGSKVVLGVTIREHGADEGLQVLHMLATSPATAKFLSRKLAVRFVCDDPPQALVDRMAKRFTETQGDIRQVLVAMINSPEFFSRDTYRAKVKTPQDFVVSAVRAAGAEVASPAALVAQVAELGMPIYGMQTPNGYSMRADPWNNTGALVSRMNFALALAANKVPGVTVNWPDMLGANAAAMTPEAKDAALETKLLHVTVSDRTRQTILNQVSADADQQETTLKQIAVKGARRDPLVNPRRQQDAPVGDSQAALAAGLLFGSPEFQRR